MSRIWGHWVSLASRFTSALEPLGRRLDPVIHFWMRTISNSLDNDDCTYTYVPETWTFYVSGNVDDEFKTDKEIGQFEGILGAVALVFVLFPTAVLVFLPTSESSAIMALFVGVFGFAYLARVKHLWTEQDAFELEVIR